MSQRTLGLVKPNATKANLEEFILNDINNSNFDLTIIEQKRMTLSREEARQFYLEHAEKDWFESLIDFMTSGEVIAFVMEGENAVSDYRELMGKTNPEEADDGTLRKKYAKHKEENSVHGSDSIQSAEREISFFFS